MAKEKGAVEDGGKKTAAKQSRTGNATIRRIAATVRAAVRDPSLSALRIMNPADVAVVLGKSKAQLEAWRSQTRKTGNLLGPPFMLTPSRKTEGYPLPALIDYIVRSTIWGSLEDHVLFALATGETGLDWSVTRFALSLLLPLANALDLPSWAEKHEILMSEGWADPAPDPDKDWICPSDGAVDASTGVAALPAQLQAMSLPNRLPSKTDSIFPLMS